MSFYEDLRKLEKEVKSSLKESNGKLSTKLKWDIEDKARKILFADYIEKLKYGKIDIDWDKISKQKEHYEQHNKSSFLKADYEYGNKNDFMRYEDLYTLITKPEDIPLVGFDINGLTTDNSDNILHFQLKRIRDSFQDANTDLFRNKAGKWHSSKHKSLKDIQNLINYHNLRDSVDKSIDRLENNAKDNMFKRGIQKLNFSLSSAKAEKIEKNIFKKFDIDMDR